MAAGAGRDPGPHRLGGQLPGPQAEDAAHLGLQIGRAQVEVQPVLLALDLGHPLQQHLDPDSAFRHQSAVAAAGRARLPWVVPRSAMLTFPCK